jgi:acyl dehydratase
MNDILYLEDLEIGEVSTFGRYEVSEDEILSFAREFDVQPFHIDPEAAGNSIYGGLIASGWHTGAMMMRMLVDRRDRGPRAAVLASPGFDDMQWFKPVRPGDVLSIRSELIEVTPSRSKPDRGSIKVRIEVLDQTEQVVMRVISLAVVARRPADANPRDGE